MDVYCAVCGEPWGTRGIHYSHTDLDSVEWNLLLNGWGCPCCSANERSRHDTPNEAHLEAWRRSVARVSEGLIEEFELEEPQFVQLQRLLTEGIRPNEAVNQLKELVPFSLSGGE